MGSSTAGKCISQNSKSSSTESKVTASSAPDNRSLKGKNKMHEENEAIIISPTNNCKHTGVKTSFDPAMSSDSGKITRIEDTTFSQDLDTKQVSRKYLDYKKFDIVDDSFDHHFFAEKIQPEKYWAKTIQQEWRILEKDLPDTIFVRVYESRMDLLRAVIIGAEGTPYHDGLFFFDVFFPHDYPAVPPKVYYHSGGLRINPNLYKSGTVCLSLLNTWHGHKNEKWTTGVSTMLQVLVSIQGLILNAKPYFNEPGFVNTRGTSKGKNNSMLYNEQTIIYSLKTMVYTMKNPPRHFRDLVIGHFHNRAVTILTKCKGYNKGVGVGCGVKFSHKFKNDVGEYMGTLKCAFKDIGVGGVDEFVPEVVSHEIVAPRRSLGQKIKAFFCIKG